MNWVEVLRVTFGSDKIINKIVEEFKNFMIMMWGETFVIMSVQNNTCVRHDVRFDIWKEHC